MRECRAEGCPHLAADGCAYCVQHDEPPRFKYAGFSGPHPTLVVDCSTCGSPAGCYCNEDGRPIDGPHQARRFAASSTSPRKDA